MCPINFWWEETYTPTTLPRSRSPHNVLHSPSYYAICTCEKFHSIVYNWASVSEPHTCDFFSIIYIICYISICDCHCTSKIAINILIFILYAARVHALPPDAEQSAPPIVKATAHQGRTVNLRACALVV